MKKSLKLIESFWPELDDLDLDGKWFQKAGVTCHSAYETIHLFQEKFGGSIISKNESVNYPPHSSDLTPLHFFLWGYVKSLVCANKPATLHDCVLFNKQNVSLLMNNLPKLKKSDTYICNITITKLY